VNSLVAFVMTLGLVFGQMQIGRRPYPVAAVTPVTQIFVGGSTDSIAVTAVTEYAFPAAVTATALDGTEANHEAYMLAGTISELRVQMSASIGTGADTFTVRINHCDPTCAAATPDVFCTMTAGQSSCVESSPTSFHVAAGDRITMALTGVNSPAAVLPSWSFKWVGDNSNESMIVNTYNADDVSATECPRMSGAHIAAVPCASLSPGSLAVPAAENFTVSGIYARSVDAMGAAGDRVITLVKGNGTGNGSLESTCQVTLNNANQTASDPCSISYSTGSAPDHIMVEDNPGASNTHTGWISLTLGLTQTSQRFQASTCNSVNPSVSAANYDSITGTTSWSGTETTIDTISDGFSATGVAFRGTTAPDNGAGTQTYNYMLRDDVANVFDCQVSETTPTCNSNNSGTPVAVVDGSMMTVRSTPAATPTGPSGFCFSWSGAGT